MGLVGRRWFLANAGGAITPPVLNLLFLYNGQSGTGNYQIGLATSTDGGVSLTKSGSNPIIGPGPGSWNSSFVVDPSYFWDGAQWVLYLAGNNGSVFSIGRYTNPNADLAAHPTAWTQASNPVLTGGAGYTQNNFPTTLLEGGTTRLWYAGWKASGAITLGYAEVTGGVLSGVGEVLGLGSSGSFDDEQVVPCCIVKVSTTYYVFYTGASDTGPVPNYRTGYATCTTPDTAGTYTKHGVLAAFSGILTLSDGLSYRSNQLRSIVSDGGGGYIGFGTAFQPTSGPLLHEVSWRSTSADLVTWSAPQGPLFPLGGGGWDNNSAENPWAVVP